MKHFVKIASVCWLFLFLMGCSANKKSVEEKLDVIASSDLNDILEELKSTGKSEIIHPNAHFKIDTLIMFQGDTARVYQAYAVVYYFYLKGISMCQVRKYRFHTETRFWDRYNLRLIFTPKKFSNELGG